MLTEFVRLKKTPQTQDFLCNDVTCQNPETVDIMWQAASRSK